MTGTNMTTIASILVFLLTISTGLAASFYVRISRAEDPEHTFNMLGPAQFYDYDLIHTNTPQMTRDTSPHHERESFQFMEAPVSLSNPVWNMFSKMSDIYRWVRRMRR